MYKLNSIHILHKILPEDSYLSNFQFQHSFCEAEALVRFNLTPVFVPQRRRFLFHVANLKCITSHCTDEGFFVIFVSCSLKKFKSFVSLCISAQRSTPVSPRNPNTQ